MFVSVLLMSNIPLLKLQENGDSCRRPGAALPKAQSCEGSIGVVGHVAGTLLIMFPPSSTRTTALHRSMRVAMAAAMALTCPTMANSRSRCRSTLHPPTSRMGSPHHTATTAHRRSRRLRPLYHPTMRAHMATSSQCSTCSKPSSSRRHISSLLWGAIRRRAGSSCRLMLGSLTTTTLPLASRSGSGQQGLHKTCMYCCWDAA